MPTASPGVYRILIATIAPGGAFTVTASALDRLGGLSFDYAASGTGEPGAKFATSIDVGVSATGALIARGIDPLTSVATSPVKFVLVSSGPRPTASGTPDASLYPSPNVPQATVPPLISPVPLDTLVPTATPLGPTVVPTIVATAAPTPLPTPIPTLPPTPTATLPTPPTSTPTPPPAPTPPPTPTLPPTLSGGSAAPGGTLPVLGTNWPVGALVVITWPDGSQVASADVQSDGRFATLVHVPQTALPGQTYRMTARGGGGTATADVVIAATYTPTLALRPLGTAPPTSGSPVSFSGAGWPPNTDYSLYFDGQPLGRSGVTSATGALGGGPNDVFSVPANTLRGTHTVTAIASGYNASASLVTQ